MPDSVTHRRRLRDYFLRHRRDFAAGFAALVVTNALTLAIPWLIKRTIDAAGARRLEEARTAALILAGVAVAMGLVRVASRTLVFNAGRKAEYDLRNELFGHLLRLPPAYFARASVGDVMSRAVNDLAQVRMVLGPGVMNIVNTSVAYAVSLTMMLYIDPSLTLWSLAPFPALLLFTRRVTRILYAANRELQDATGDLTSRIQENLAGQAVLRTYRREQAEIAIFEGLNTTLLARTMRLAVMRGTLWPVFGGIAGLGSLIVLWVGGRRVFAGTMGLGDFVAFNAYLTGLAWPTLALGWILALLQRGRAAMARINEVFEVPEVADPTADRPPPAPARGRVEARGLEFSYGGRAILRDISLELPAGKTLAVVGPTASGKSTLVNLLTRLADTPPGMLFLDGVDVTALPLQHLRRAVAVAPQDPFLFSATIAENIAYGRPELDRAAVERAATIAHLTPDLTGFPRGLDTLVGERGITLSGGQRQRVAIARAVAVDPAVLVLDDPLSSVDAETADAVLAALRDALAGRTGIVITHRLAAARQADLVAVLEEGRLVELGPHDALLARGGLYSRLWREERLAAELERMGEDEAA